MKKTFAIAIAALLAGSLAGTAQATTTGNVRQQVVSYTDLDLENDADAAILYSRIESAARIVCGMHLGPVPLAIQLRLDSCADEATARAVADVNAPTLTRKGELVVRTFVK